MDKYRLWPEKTRKSSTGCASNHPATIALFNFGSNKRNLMGSGVVQNVYVSGGRNCRTLAVLATDFL
jgi:hypothetical protein